MTNLIAKTMSEHASSITRYTDEIPWRVKVTHIKEYPARMLRLLGKRRSGQSLSETEDQRLNSWLKKLDEDNAVIGYDPDSTFGFYYIDKDEDTDGLDGIPVRRQTFSVLD